MLVMRPNKDGSFGTPRQRANNVVQRPSVHCLLGKILPFATRFLEQSHQRPFPLRVVPFILLQPAFHHLARRRRNTDRGLLPCNRARRQNRHGQAGQPPSFIAKLSPFFSCQTHLCCPTHFFLNSTCKHQVSPLASPRVCPNSPSRHYQVHCPPPTPPPAGIGFPHKKTEHHPQIGSINEERCVFGRTLAPYSRQRESWERGFGLQGGETPISGLLLKCSNCLSRPGSRLAPLAGAYITRPSIPRRTLSVNTIRPSLFGAARRGTACGQRRHACVDMGTLVF